MAETILEVRNLVKHFKTSRGMLHAVDDVSLPWNVAGRWVWWANPAAESPPQGAPSCG